MALLRRIQEFVSPSPFTSFAEFGGTFVPTTPGSGRPVPKKVPTKRLKIYDAAGNFKFRRPEGHPDLTNLPEGYKIEVVT